MAPTPIAVTGATGEIGRRVAEKLLADGADIRVVVRDAARLAPGIPAGAARRVGGYADRDGMRVALEGVSTMLLVSAHETEDRLEQHRSAIAAAVDAGVRRIVYTSFLGAAANATFTLARQHFQTEELLRASGLDCTILRDSLYLDVLPDLADEDGVIRGPAGDGHLAGVARDDVADVAAAILLDGGHSATYELTGRERFTLHDAASALSKSTGRRFTYRPESVAEAFASREHYRAPRWQVEAWVSTYTAIAAGELDVVTDHVEAILGRAARTLTDVTRCRR